MEIVLPTTTQGKSNLYKGIMDKVLADGIGGECHALIIAQGIDVVADYDSTLDALVHEENNIAKVLLREINNEKFQGTLAATNKVSRGIAKYLKMLNAPMFKNGGDYGINYSDSGAVIFPTTHADQVLLFQNINKHYLTFAPGTCPIEPYLVAQRLVMATLASALEDVIVLKSSADQLNRDALNETQLRNKDMATPEINIHKFANFLQILHPNDARMLGLYKFITSDAPSLEKDQISSVTIGKDKILQHIVRDSMLVNMTGDPVIVHKGIKKRGKGITIPGYGELKMDKGCSKVIVDGTNAKKEGTVKVRVWR